jgi:hypothetical protein
MKYALKNAIARGLCRINNALHLAADISDSSDIRDHLPILTQQAERASFIVELGTRGGVSTRALIEGAKRNKATVLSVDMYPCSSVADYENWIFVQADDIEFAQQFPKWCAERRLKPSIDLLFVDTSHEYEHTRKEIANWFPLLSFDGTAIFHDTNMQRFYRRQDGTIWVGGGDKRRGVIRALHEFLGTGFDESRDFSGKTADWRITHHALCNGLTILHRSSSGGNH